MPYLSALRSDFEIKEMAFGLVASQGFLQKRYFIFSFSFPLQDFPQSSAGKESACNEGDPDCIPGLGRTTGEWIGYPVHHSWVSLVAQLVKNSPAVGDLRLIPGLGRSPGEGNTTNSSIWPGEFHALYSLWGCKE